MRKILTFGYIKNGILKISHKQEFLKSISAMPDCRVKLEVSKLYKKRSNDQNAYYWGVIVEIWQQIILEEWGEHWSIEEVHEFLKYNFNSEEKVNENTGEILKVGRSTTKNTTTEQEEFQAICREKAFEMFNVVIPVPNEQLELL